MVSEDVPHPARGAHGDTRGICIIIFRNRAASHFIVGTHEGGRGTCVENARDTITIPIIGEVSSCLILTRSLSPTCSQHHSSGCRQSR